MCITPTPPGWRMKSEGRKVSIRKPEEESVHLTCPARNPRPLWPQDYPTSQASRCEAGKGKFEASLKLHSKTLFQKQSSVGYNAWMSVSSTVTAQCQNCIWNLQGRVKKKNEAPPVSFSLTPFPLSLRLQGTNQLLEPH